MKKILVVDDEEDVLFILKKTLTAKGYSVITAANGTDAIALARSQHPDLIILDIVMPGMDGGGVAAELQGYSSTKSIPVIFLTALLTRTEEYRKDHVIGSNITFAKPIDTQEFLAHIEDLLGSCQPS